MKSTFPFFLNCQRVYLRDCWKRIHHKDRSKLSKRLIQAHKKLHHILILLMLNLRDCPSARTFQNLLKITKFIPENLKFRVVTINIIGSLLKSNDLLLYLGNSWFVTLMKTFSKILPNRSSRLK